MTVSADTPILHHYETSPFSEKVRVAFGIKGLAWRSVLIPNMMPKPDLLPLTGGYRRTPVMQIGADVYCDTQVMLAELDAPSRAKTGAPTPRLARGSADWMVNFWADRPFFQATVPLIFGELGDRVPQTFIEDREQLSGRPFDLAAMKAAGPLLAPQWRAHAGWIEAGLSASEWLDGESPGLADAAAYMNVWFLQRNLPHRADALLSGLERTQAWAGRLAALGHGAREELTAAAALDLAAAAQPAPSPPHDAADPLGLAPGAAVYVMADDYGRDRIEGRLVAANPERLVITREDARVGRVNLHFPRAGYFAGAC